MCDGLPSLCQCALSRQRLLPVWRVAACCSRALPLPPRHRRCRRAARRALRAPRNGGAPSSCGERRLTLALAHWSVLELRIKIVCSHRPQIALQRTDPRESRSTASLPRALLNKSSLLQGVLPTPLAPSASHLECLDRGATSASRRTGRGRGLEGHRGGGHLAWISSLVVCSLGVCVQSRASRHATQDVKIVLGHAF